MAERGANLRLPITEYGTAEIGAAAVACAAMGVCAWFTFKPALAVPVFIFLFVLYFFRDPERTAPVEPGALISPADGVVIEIGDVREDDYLAKDAVKVAIFMAVWNVHVNRAPCEGRVDLIKYRKGRFMHAGKPDAAMRNEANSVGLADIVTGKPKLMVRQIAGMIAQRITCAIGDVLRGGQRFGMVKFGSRVEVFVPKELPFEVAVKIGDKVSAGLTVLGRFKGA
jgi:phosphatidylserine decarboxylase